MMIKIRRAEDKELEEIRKQRVAAYEEHAKSISPEHWKALKQAISSGADQENGAEILVAELEGSVVGSVVLCPENTDAYKGLTGMSEYPEIRMLAVAPEARKKGAALALVKACLEKAKESGHQAIGLHTADFMERAMALYQKLGFKRLPEYDFEPANDGVIVKAFRYTFTDNK